MLGTDCKGNARPSDPVLVVAGEVQRREYDDDEEFSNKTWWGVLTLACFAFLVSGAAPIPKDARPKVESLAGTTWSGPDSDGDDFVYTFEKDGTLSYKSPTGTYNNGKWKQSWASVYFETNDHYSEYLGGDQREDNEWEGVEHGRPRVDVGGREGQVNWMCRWHGTAAVPVSLRSPLLFASCP